jgi:hypothetical protein
MQAGIEARRAAMSKRGSGGMQRYRIELKAAGKNARRCLNVGTSAKRRATIPLPPVRNPVLRNDWKMLVLGDLAGRPMMASLKAMFCAFLIWRE